MSGHSGPAPDELPRTVGRYRINARLAGSSADDVYLGFDPMIERPVVVKAFRLRSIDPAAHAAIKQAFYQEMQRTGLLMHHGIAALFDAGEEPGMLFMATEYLDGVSLSERLAAGLTWDLPARASVVVQMLDALDFACQLGVPHLNLKPTNVVIGPGHNVKVGGFGVGSFLRRLAAASSVPLAPVSPYAPPELARGESGDERSDVYSAALIARDLCLGPEPRSVLPAYLAESGVKASALDAVFERALAVDPDRRYQTPEALKIELLLALGVADGHAWSEPHGSGEHGSVDSPPGAVTMLTPSGVYVLPDNAFDPVASSEFPIDTGEAPTMTQAPSAKPAKS